MNSVYHPSLNNPPKYTQLNKPSNYQKYGGVPKQIKGMSNADDLISVWNKFKSDNEPDLIVNWNFTNPDKPVRSNDGSKGYVYIMNLRSLYNPKVPGHWVALIRLDTEPNYSKIYYYDPFGTILSKRGVNKLDCRYILENVTKEQNFNGENSDSCGYYCILWLLSWLRNGYKNNKYDYVLFDKKYNRFTDTTPNDRYIKMNLNAMETELANNIQSSKMLR